MFDKITEFLSRITRLDQQFIKFLFVGALNTVFSYLIYAFFIFIGLGYACSLLFATIAGILFNFKTIGILVFKNNQSKLIFKFILNYVILYLFSLILFKLLFGLITSNLYIIHIIIVIITTPVNFIFNKKFVFNQ